MRCFKRTSNYIEIITLFDLTHMMSMVDLVGIGGETSMIDNEWSLEKEFF